MRFLSSIFFIILSLCSFRNIEVKELEYNIMEGEFWWMGLSSVGHKTPYDSQAKITFNLWGNNFGNQAQPLLLSNKGRYIWSENPLKIEFDYGKLKVSVKDGHIVSGSSGNNLKSAFKYAVKHFFPPNQLLPEALMFTQPQYNTWIELTYDQNEADILEYAQSIIDQGYPPGVLMIDDNWQEDYGVWTFSKKRFSNPKKMIERLHEMGFKVMMWVCPFVSPDSEVSRSLEEKGLLIQDPSFNTDLSSKNTTSIIRWWNGASACLDLSNPESRLWFKEQLDHLVEEYKVDGFKFDAGDADFYVEDIVTYTKGSPNDQTAYFAMLGLDYPLNEFRASWKMAGLPLAQRLRDKEHKWEDLRKLIPDMMSQSMMGYAYTCPDMIGGGEFKSFLNLSNVDEELIVRSAQVHALMPMMQFSVAPWRVLSEENNKICRQAAHLHASMGDYILKLAVEASISGEPIVKPLDYVFPALGYEMVKDQFVLGEEYVVAPVVEKGGRSRDVILPPGKWESDLGVVYDGGRTITIDVPLNRLPFFKKMQ